MFWRRPVFLAAASLQSTTQRVQERFGPQAKLLHRTKKVRGSPQPQQMAVVTFRRQAFSIDVVAMTGTAGVDKDDLLRQGAELVLASDLRSSPSASHVVKDRLDDTLSHLRYLALGMGRMLRFVIHLNTSTENRNDGSGSAMEEDESDETEGSGSPAEGSRGSSSGVCGTALALSDCKCNIFVKDDWAVANKFVLHSSVNAETPGGALDAAIHKILSVYEAEGQESPQALEDISEVARFLKLSGKKVRTHLEHDSGGDTVSVTATVVDEWGNSYHVTSAKQKTAYVGYRSCALQIFKHESYDPFRPFPSKLLWSIESLCETLYGPTEQAKRPPRSLADSFLHPPPDTVVRYRVLKNGETGCYESRLTFGQHNLLEKLETVSAGGMYLLQLRTFKAALASILESAPKDVIETCSSFRTPEALAKEYDELMAFSVVDALKDHQRLTPYSVVGQLTWRHFHEYYSVNYSVKQDPTTGEDINLCEMFVRDKVLGSATHKSKGQSWKLACADILINNFPDAWEEVRNRTEFQQLAAEVKGEVRGTRAAAQSTTSSVLSGIIPVSQLNSAQALLQIYGRHRVGWIETTIETSQIPGDSSKWVAKFMVKTEDAPDSWETLMATSPVQSKGTAKKFLTYLIAHKYFPEELEEYLSLNRSDLGSPADIRFFKEKATAVYDPSLPIIEQVVSHIAKTAGTQLSVSLDHFVADVEKVTGNVALNDGATEGLLRSFVPRYIATVRSGGGESSKPIVQQVGQEGHSATTTIRSALRSAAFDLQAQSSEISRIWQEYGHYIPAQISTVRDLCHYLFTSFFGHSVTAEIEYLEVYRVWVSTLVVATECETAIARGYGHQKKDAISAAWITGAKENFEKTLEAYSHELSLQHVVDELYSTKILSHEEAFPPEVLAQRGSGGTTVVVPGTPSLYPTPSAALKVFMEEQDPGFIARHEQHPMPDGTYRCIIYRQKEGNIVPSRGTQLQVLGRGVGNTKRDALHNACVAALRVTFPEDLDEILKANPYFCELPM